jgi:hypothetical protein
MAAYQVNWCAVGKLVVRGDSEEQSFVGQTSFSRRSSAGGIDTTITTSRRLPAAGQGSQAPA